MESGVNYTHVNGYEFVLYVCVVSTRFPDAHFDLFSFFFHFFSQLSTRLIPIQYRYNNDKERFQAKMATRLVDRHPLTVDEAEIILEMWMDDHVAPEKKESDTESQMVLESTNSYSSKTFNDILDDASGNAYPSHHRITSHLLLCLCDDWALTSFTWRSLTRLVGYVVVFERNLVLWQCNPVSMAA